ncbi:MAG: 16S rRNA (uracil(1498)-N(3))-methyltransferase [Alphaproteobacteria bacterium]|nr:16S rRNA (uracil(1498)-N(3))-methyltransferase [Alphaproteobacteria bacterium]
MNKPRTRLATDAALDHGAQVTLTGNAAHYLAHVLRLGAGDAVALFNRTQGEWHATIDAVRKKEVTLAVGRCLRAPDTGGAALTVCFAPLKGGRMETVIEKATELGARVLQPVITRRSVVDKVNLARAMAIAREAAEQCERIDWPEIREPVKLPDLLGDWPADMPLVYGDESGNSDSMAAVLNNHAASSSALATPPRWAVLTGPEGGFAPDELAALARVKPAIGVGLGPRILRADTAVITLCALTMQRWGDWHQRPRFTFDGEA